MFWNKKKQKKKVLMPTRAEAEQYFADIKKYGPDLDDYPPNYIYIHSYQNDVFEMFLKTVDVNDASCGVRVIEKLIVLVDQVKTVDDFIDWIRNYLLRRDCEPVEQEEQN